MAPKRAASNSKTRAKPARTVEESAALASVARDEGSSDAKKFSALNPPTHGYEWGGPFGSFMTILFLPVVVLAMNSACGPNAPQCRISEFFSPAPPPPELAAQGYVAPSGSVRFEEAWHENWIFMEHQAAHIPFAVVILLCWYAFHCIFYLVWPLGGRGPGMQLRNGKTLNYNFNALWAMIVAYALIFGGHFLGYFDIRILVDLFVPLMLASILLAVVFSVMLYVGSYRAGGIDKLTALGGNTGNIFYDFWVGRELNPRFGELDFKWVFELRPGLIGWTILCWAFVITSYGNIIARFGAPKNGLSDFLFNENYRSFTPLLGACLTNFIYVIDALYFEPGNVTMMDIVHDGFGFMLCFGDIAWVPFLYTMQCKFLFLYPQKKLSLAWLAFSAGVYILGYFAFRGANSQKDQFRKDPTDPRVAHLKTLATTRGTKLIVSSWWGICRHPNYVGDWLMVVGTSLFTGGEYLLPWFQPVYFAILLLHRQLRDEEWMLKKYGKEDWEAYCKKVPYRLIPGVY